MSLQQYLGGENGEWECAIWGNHNELKCKKSPFWQDNTLLPERLKSMFFEKETWSEERISKNVDFSL